jgi:hypothetical protein
LIILFEKGCRILTTFFFLCEVTKHLQKRSINPICRKKLIFCSFKASFDSFITDLASKNRSNLSYTLPCKSSEASLQTACETKLINPQVGCFALRNDEPGRILALID